MIRCSMLANLLPPWKIAKAFKVSCPEEIAFRKGWIDSEKLQSLAQPLIKNGYGKYLMRILTEEMH